MLSKSINTAIVGLLKALTGRVSDKMLYMTKRQQTPTKFSNGFCRQSLRVIAADEWQILVGLLIMK
ncbi:MAG: hypothetical protein H2069_07465 [Legionella sp.]|nr:hypothetical protein [Legionella sp.]